MECGQMTLKVEAVDLNRILVDAATRFRSSGQPSDLA